MYIEYMFRLLCVFVNRADIFNFFFYSLRAVAKIMQKIASVLRDGRRYVVYWRESNFSVELQLISDRALMGQRYLLVEPGSVILCSSAG